MTATAQRSAFELTESPSHLLHRAQQFAADRFTNQLNGAGLTQRQFAVLSAVAASEGLTQTDLTRATGIDRSTLAELVKRMSDRALLRRERAKSDARANAVSLTASGRNLFNKTRAQVEEVDRGILDALPKNKRAAFVDILQRLDRALGEEDEGLAVAPTPTAAEASEAKPKAKKTKAKAKDKAKAKATKKTPAKAVKKPEKRAAPAKATKTAKSGGKPAKGAKSTKAAPKTKRTRKAAA